MSQTPTPLHAPAWVFLTHVSFFASLAMLVGGVFVPPIDMWMRAFLFRAC